MMPTTIDIRMRPHYAPTLIKAYARRCFDLAVSLYRRDPTDGAGYALVLAMAAVRTSSKLADDSRRDVWVASSASVNEAIAQIDAVRAARDTVPLAIKDFETGRRRK